MESAGKKHTTNFELNAHQLRGKQSVRATFRLSDQMIDLLKVAAAHLEVKQKSLIDELVQNRETLNRVAEESAGTGREQKKRRQKTFVLSRHSLDLLDTISEKYNLSRDHLVELCIGRLIPFVDAEQEKHKQRRQLIKEFDQYLSDGKQLLEKTSLMLGSDDRFRNKFGEIISYTEKTIEELRSLVKEKNSLIY